MTEEENKENTEKSKCLFCGIEIPDDQEVHSIIGQDSICLKCGSKVNYVNSVREKGFKHKFKMPKINISVNYVALASTCLLVGWILSQIFMGLMVLPYVNPVNIPNNNNTTTIPIDTTIPETTVPLTSTPLPTDGFELVEYPNGGDPVMFFVGGVSGQPIQKIWFRFTVKDNSGSGGNVNINCEIFTTTSTKYGGSTSLYLQPNEEKEFELIFDINSNDFDYINWSSASVNIIEI